MRSFVHSALATLAGVALTAGPDLNAQTSSTQRPAASSTRAEQYLDTYVELLTASFEIALDDPVIKPPSREEQAHHGGRT